MRYAIVIEKAEGNYSATLAEVEAEFREYIEVAA